MYDGDNNDIIYANTISHNVIFNNFKKYNRCYVQEMKIVQY